MTQSQIDKGRIYELIAQEVIQSIFPPCDMPAIKSYYVKQDLSFSYNGERFTVGVTHWGSHEAAKMKIWRMQEDIFEVWRFSNDNFVCFTFEVSRDIKLASLITDLLAGLHINEKNSTGMIQLQNIVRNNWSKVSQSSTLAAGMRIIRSDHRFSAALALAASDLNSIISTSINNHKSINKAPYRQNPVALVNFSGSRTPYYKELAIQTLVLGMANLNLILSNHRSGKTTSQTAQSNPDLFTSTGIASTIKATDVLLFIDGNNGWIATFDNLYQNMNSNPLSQQMMDLNNNVRLTRIAQFHSALQSNTLVALMNIPGYRNWPLDYYSIIQRSLTPNYAYGFGKICDDLGITFSGGVSPVTKYVAGDSNALNSVQKASLVALIGRNYSNWPKGLNIDAIIWKDRISLMAKKYDALGIYIDNIASNLGYTVNRNVVFKHPVILAQGRNGMEGSTAMNFKLSRQDREIYAFVVSTFDSTHKHKEVSARLRAIKASKAFSESAEFLLVIDGNFMGTSSNDKLEMLTDAGWTAVIYVDEMDKYLKSSSNVALHSFKIRQHKVI